jgi:hypothetical protein
MEDRLICQLFPQNLFAVAYSKVSYAAGVKVLNRSKFQCHWTKEVRHICCFTQMLLLHSESAQVTGKSHYSILHCLRVLLINCVYVIRACFRLSVWSYFVLFYIKFYRTTCYTFSEFMVDWDQQLNKVWNTVSVSNAYLFLKAFEMPLV